MLSSINDFTAIIMAVLPVLAGLGTIYLLCVTLEKVISTLVGTTALVCNLCRRRSPSSPRDKCQRTVESLGKARS